MILPNAKSIIGFLFRKTKKSLKKKERKAAAALATVQ